MYNLVVVILTVLGLIFSVFVLILLSVASHINRLKLYVFYVGFAVIEALLSFYLSHPSCLNMSATPDNSK